MDFRDIASDIFAAGQEYDRGEPDRLKRHRQLDPESGELLWITVLASRPNSILEIGTGSGVSTMYLADAARQLGRRVTTVDIVTHEDVVANLERAGVANVVDRLVRDAGELLPTLPAKSIDFLFLDAERSLYMNYLPHIIDVLNSGAVLFVDNALRPSREEIAPFLEVVAAHSEMRGSQFDIGHGVEIFVKR
jgi:predicted O-methyltransferase YrrM